MKFDGCSNHLVYVEYNTFFLNENETIESFETDEWILQSDTQVI